MNRAGQLRWATGVQRRYMAMCHHAAGAMPTVSGDPHGTGALSALDQLQASATELRTFVERNRGPWPSVSQGILELSRLVEALATGDGDSDEVVKAVAAKVPEVDAELRSVLSTIQGVDGGPGRHGRRRR